MGRREFLKGGIGTASLLAAATWGLLSPVSAADPTETRGTGLPLRLAEALRSIGTAPCLAKATQLESIQEVDRALSFHLRSAGLDVAATLTVAAALRSLSETEASYLASFSLSYNQGIGDAGAVPLARALPQGLRELGLVGCGIGDQGGEALLQWASHASRLRMMCIEGNNFSRPLTERFRELAGQRSGLFVVV